MKNMIIKKENGVITYKKLNEDDSNSFINSVKKSHHLCSTCDNCSPIKYLKVFDIDKQVINNYHFITDGYQIFNVDGEAVETYVSKCNHFSSYKPRKKITTLEEIEELNRKKENLKMMYFDAESFEEAEQTQYDLLRRGQISFNNTRERRK